MSRRGGAALILGLALLAWAALSLADLRRASRARGAAVAANALPGIRGPAGRSLIAADRRDALARIATLMADRAAAAGVRLAVAPRTGGAAPAGIVRARIVARGEEARLRAFAHAIEDGVPILRWTRWSIAAGAGGRLLLTADVAAPVRLRGGPAGHGAPPPAAIARAALPLTPAMATRPLFAAPADEALSGIVAPEDAAPELIGIAGRLPDDAVAMLRFGDGTTRSLSRGAQAGGWRVLAIAADRVRLAHDGREQIAVLPPTS